MNTTALKNYFENKFQKKIHLPLQNMPSYLISCGNINGAMLEVSFSKLAVLVIPKDIFFGFRVTIVGWHPR